MKRICFLTLPFFLCFISFQPATAQVNYNAEMKALSRNIQQYFYLEKEGYYKETVHPEKDGRPVSYLWPLCAMLQASNETRDARLMKQVYMVIGKYLDPRSPAPGYASYPMEKGGGSRFYDDNQWIGITAMDTYERTGKKAYLETGKLIYRFMMTGYDTISGGGLYWKEDDKKCKNTCSNGPGILLALQLHHATKEQAYLDTALLLYRWTNQQLKAPNGVFYDNIEVPGGKLVKWMFSYNAGTMLQSNVYLYEATGDTAYLTEARGIAKAASAYFLSGEKFRDAYWFNAVLLRGYAHLLRHDTDTTHIAAFRACLDREILHHKSANGLFKKEKELDLVAQGGMLEMLARFAAMQRDGMLQ